MARQILAEAERPEAEDGSGNGTETGPLRRCIVTRETLPKAAMLRFVVCPEGSLIFDAASTLPGRGLWLSAGRDVIEAALKRGVFAKAAKQRVSVDDRLIDQVALALERRISELLGLARRSGAALAGFEKVRKMLAVRKCAVLIEASDGSIGERARLLNGRAIPAFTPLDAARLGGIFGRETVIHVGLAPGRLAQMIGADATRLAGIKGETRAAQPIAIAGKNGQRDARRKGSMASA